MKLSFKTILPILLIFTLLILFTGCFITPSPGYIPPTYIVTYNGNTNTSGVAPTDANLYEQGVSVTVLAPGSLVKTGYTFDSWNTAANGSGISQAAGSSFIMGTANVTLYAQWTANPTYTPSPGYTGGPTPTPATTYTLTIAVNPPGEGTTTPAVGSYTYDEGTVVTITANPASGYHFVNWAGAVTGSVNPTTVTMNTNKMVTANFAEILPDQYTLAVNTVGSGSVTKSPDQATYLSGTIVTLDPQAAAGWTFTGWSGDDLSGSTDPADITMNSNKTVTATFTQNEYTLTVFISPLAAETAGCAVNRNDAGPYKYGDVVQLTSNAAAGWTFSHWEGNLTGSTDPDNVIMDADKTVTANFVPTYIVTYNGNTNTSGVAPTDANLYEQGVSVTVLAPGSLVKTGYTFDSWNTAANGSGTKRVALSTFIMDMANVTLYAQWTANPTYTLTTAVDPVGSGSVSGAGTYDAGTNVPVEATAATGYVFDHWSGDLTGSTNPTTILMDGNKSVTAHFTEEKYTLTVNIVGSGNVGVAPAGPYSYGTVVTLDPQAAAGWTFAGWSGDLSGSADPANITMNSNKSVTATFVPAYTLTVTIVGNGTVTLDPVGGTYASGTSVKLTAVADAGWVFKDWSGALSGTTSPKNITMNSNKTVTANFETCALTIVAGSGLVTITSNYGDVVTGSAVATFTSGGATWKDLGNNLQARVTTDFPTKMNTLVLTPIAVSDEVTITGTKDFNGTIPSKTLEVVVRDKTDTTITKSFTVVVSGSNKANVLTIGTIIVLQ